jgi:hypothetical protein
MYCIIHIVQLKGIILLIKLVIISMEAKPLKNLFGSQTILEASQDNFTHDEGNPY